MLYDQNLENAKMREHAQELLEEYKKVEGNTKMYEMRLNKNTVVYCKDKTNFNKYKRKEKEAIVCRID